MRTSVSPWWLGILWFWLSAVAGAAEIGVAVDRNPVALNESFQITFTATEQPDGNPDLEPLRQDFEIVNQQRSSSASWVNGKSNRNEQWVLTAMAKRSGELTIPAIAFGADSSKPLALTVTEAAQPTAKDDELFLEVSATPEQPYVQAQVIYTLKLFRRVQITQASLAEPEIKDALVEKLGEDSTYSTQIKGVDYWVTERKYAIFPQQSGLFTIAPLVLNAEYISSRQQPRFNGFFNRPSTETRRVVSKAVTLNVRAAPAEFKGAWLSAESLELSEGWSDSSLQVKVGEPLTRTLTLKARGATVGQLPELFDKTPIDGIKTYPDQPLLHEDKQSDGLTASREEKIAFIPSKPGEYSLPALKIQWFNSKSQKIEVAALPAVKIKALAAAEVATPTASATESEPEQASPITATPIAVTSDSGVRLWQAVSAVLAMGWLLTVIGFVRSGRQRRQTRAASMAQSESALEKAIKRACWENNPQAAKQLLLQWGRAEFGADSLAGLASRCDQPLCDEINDLNRLLYAPGGQEWQGRDLWTAFSGQARRAAAPAPLGDGLEPLFKI
ncbi:BatD family protein [Methylomonas sp. EFPC3]|uniref:BatD family protein n=1 Tax=Methylomonas sp. EFPC3 TaxID=3021710 RepID=UPI00241731B1|nr:BatD family protein [Methylomonas sp. EFPC3]WFP48976.1 BatD family protein [Methylomonas sp. EFPC3]